MDRFATVVLAVSTLAIGCHREVLSETHDLASVEERCKELAQDCVCAERLDNNDDYAPQFHNPSDSIDKECGDWTARSAGKGTSRFPVPFPPEATTRNVLFMERDTSFGKISHTMGGGEFDMTGKTVCVRSYRLYGLDHAPPGNVKIARQGHPDGVAWQSAWAIGGQRPRLTVVSRLNGNGRVDCNLGDNATEENRLRFEDCQTHWCRFEICAEHDPRNGQFNFRARWRQVGGTRGMDADLLRDGGSGPDCVAETGATALILSRIDVAEFATVSPPPSDGGSVFLSHLMLAVTSYNPEFWVGPAVEIEPGQR